MKELRGRGLLFAVTSLTSIGFFMIGYDNGLFGGFVEGKAFQESFGEPSPTTVGVIVGIYEIGCFVGSVITAWIGDHLGRRRSMGWGVVIMILGAILQATAFSLAHLIIGRIVSGIGMGFINSTGPVLQAEFSPKTSRGLFVCMQLSTLNFGIALVYWIDFALIDSSLSAAWRIPIILQCLFLFAMLALVFVIPESPRWLISHNRQEEAVEVLARLKGGALTERHMRRLCKDIVRAVSVQCQKGAASWGDLWRDDALRSRRRFLIACGIQAMQQLGGINAIIFYSGTIFGTSIGFDSHMAALMSGFLQTWFFVASFIPWGFIDRIGRRPLLLSMIFVMATVLAAQSGLVYQIEKETATQAGAAIAAAAMLFIFQGAFTIGFQATVWVYPSEILPIQLRQRGSSISTASNWICNYMVVQITPIAIANIGWRTYIIFATLNFAFLPIIYLFFPETKGLELEDVDMLFADSESVQMSIRARQRGRIQLDDDGFEFGNSTTVTSVSGTGASSAGPMAMGRSPTSTWRGRSAEYHPTGPFSPARHIRYDHEVSVDEDDEDTLDGSGGFGSPPGAPAVFNRTRPLPGFGQVLPDLKKPDATVAPYHAVTDPPPIQPPMSRLNNDPANSPMSRYWQATASPMAQAPPPPQQPPPQTTSRHAGGPPTSSQSQEPALGESRWERTYYDDEDSESLDR